MNAESLLVNVLCFSCNDKSTILKREQEACLRCTIRCGLSFCHNHPPSHPLIDG